MEVARMALVFALSFGASFAGGFALGAKLFELI